MDRRRFLLAVAAAPFALRSAVSGPLAYVTADLQSHVAVVDLEHGDGVLAEDGRAQPQLVEVTLDRSNGVGVALDEHDALGAARERLEPDRTRPRVQVEYGRTVDRADDVEDVLAHAVGGRPRVLARRGTDRMALPRAGDDPHEA